MVCDALLRFMLLGSLLAWQPWMGQSVRTRAASDPAQLASLLSKLVGIKLGIGCLVGTRLLDVGQVDLNFTL